MVSLGKFRLIQFCQDQFFPLWDCSSDVVIPFQHQQRLSIHQLSKEIGGDKIPPKTKRLGL